MTPVWRLAALGLGAGTALMGEKAAHACTEAVESVIEEHYADQIAEAPGYRLLSSVIKAGCRAAIKISERV